VIVALFVYVLVVGALYFFQETLLFRPPLAVNGTLPSNAITHQITVEDDVRLNLIELRTLDDAPYVLFFHGNGSLAYYEIGRGQRFAEAGYNVLLAEYRGYGGSDGSPTGANILFDALFLHHDWIKERGAVDIFVAGHSLGTGPATYIAANRDVKALALEAPYSSLADVAADRYPFAPVKLLFKHDILSANFMQNVDESVLIMHGNRDRIIPIKFGRKLFEYAKSDDIFIEIEHGEHGVSRFGSVERTIEFFNQYRQ